MWQAEKRIEILMFIFFLRKLEEREDFQELGVNGRLILKWNLKIWSENKEYIRLAQNRDKYPAVVSILGLRKQMLETSWLGEVLTVFHEGLCYSR